LIVLILSLDTSAAACSVALRQDGKTLSKSIDYMDRGHAEALMPMVKKVMKSARCTPKKIQLIAVTIGPGAFTGLRLGIAAARGIALATGTECIGLTSTETLAASLMNVKVDGCILAIMSSKRSDVYAQAFKGNVVPITEPSAITPKDICKYFSIFCDNSSSCTLVGDAQDLVAPYLIEAGWNIKKSLSIFPDAAILAGLAEARWKLGLPYRPPKPLYIRPPDASIPKNEGRLRN
tara:strand:- start:467 stop:1171 length:705 start_codon:yes stop_codon:yes gene_type:complete